MKERRRVYDWTENGLRLKFGSERIYTGLETHRKIRGTIEVLRLTLSRLKVYMPTGAEYVLYCRLNYIPLFIPLGPEISYILTCFRFFARENHIVGAADVC